MTGSPSQTQMELSQTRKQFEKEILKIIYGSRGCLYEWRTKEWIQNKIKDLEKNEKFYGNTYKVQERCANKVLIIGKSYLGNDCQMIPIEDYFDVIYAAHIFTGHGTKEIMKKYLQNSKLLVPQSALICFLKLCGACKAIKREKTPKGIMYHGYLELVDVSDTPDGDKKFVMHYKALKIKRSFLRPLSSSNAIEVAEQLRNLFCEIGPPRVLRTPSKSYTKALILRLAIVYPDYKIICGGEMELKRKTKSIKAKIRKWMTDNDSSEWSKAICYPHRSELFKRRQKSSLSSLTDVFDVNLQEPSSNQHETTLKNQAHERYLTDTNISADEVLQLLKPTETYRNITPQTTPVVSSNLQSQKRVCRTYTRKKKQNSQIVIPLNNIEDAPLGKRALCINRNLKQCKMSNKSMKKIYDIWNSTLDLPDSPVSNVKNIIGINIVYNANFGIIPKEPVAFLDEISQYRYPDESSSDALNSKDIGEYNEIRQTKFPNKTPTDAMERKNIKLEELSLETTTDYSALEGMVLKEEMPPFVIADDFSEEKPCSSSSETPIGFSALPSTVIKKEMPPFVIADYFSEEAPCFVDINNFESKDIKEEILFETSTTFDDLRNNIIKKEEQLFGKVVKVESCNE